MIEIIQVINLWQMIRFALDGLILERRLVDGEARTAEELSAASPVGKLLLTAAEGEELETWAPGGPVTIKVLAIT